jgi:hypothetical protein
MIHFWWRVNKLVYTRPWREALDEIKDMVTSKDDGSSRRSSGKDSTQMQSRSKSTTATTSSTDSVSDDI